MGVAAPSDRLSRGVAGVPMPSVPVMQQECRWKSDLQLVCAREHGMNGALGGSI